MTNEQLKDRRRQIADVIRAGVSPWLTCEKFGVSIATVKNACLENGFEIGFKKRKAKDDLRKKMSDMVESGSTVAEVALRFGVTYPTVKMACWKNGVTPKITSVYSEKYLGLDWTMTDAALSRLVGVCRERIRQVRMKLGMPKVKPRKVKNQCSSLAANVARA